MLELQRNVIFGQYVDTRSPIHRLDPRLKILATGLLVIISFLLPNLVGFALVLPLLVVLQVVSRVPFGYLFRGSRVFLIFLAVILALEVLFYPGPAARAIWHWSFLSISPDGLRAAGLVAARVLLLYDVTTMLMLTTAMVDLTDALEALFGPLQRLGVPVNELVLVGVIALKFVPIFTAEAERLSRAHTARGVPFDQGGPVVKAQRIGRLLVPIFISGFRRADILTMAMDARVYRGGRGRTKLRQFHAGGIDWLTLTLVAGWLAAAWWVSARVLA